LGILCRYKRIDLAHRKNMTASMFQGEGGYMATVGQKMKTHLPGQTPGLKQGSEGPVMSDMQFMQMNERKQHEDTYRYEHGHNDDNVPLGSASF
jgi:hypothetical protein